MACAERLVGGRVAPVHRRRDDLRAPSSARAARTACSTERISVTGGTPSGVGASTGTRSSSWPLNAVISATSSVSSGRPTTTACRAPLAGAELGRHARVVQEQPALPRPQRPRPGRDAAPGADAARPCRRGGPAATSVDELARSASARGRSAPARPRRPGRDRRPRRDVHLDAGLRHRSAAAGHGRAGAAAAEHGARAAATPSSTSWRSAVARSLSCTTGVASAGRSGEVTWLRRSRVRGRRSSALECAGRSGSSLGYDGLLEVGSSPGVRILPVRRRSGRYGPLARAVG